MKNIKTSFSIFKQDKLLHCLIIHLVLGVGHNILIAGILVNLQCGISVPSLSTKANSFNLHLMMQGIAAIAPLTVVTDVL